MGVRMGCWDSVGAAQVLEFLGKGPSKWVTKANFSAAPYLLPLSLDLLAA